MDCKVHGSAGSLTRLSNSHLRGVQHLYVNNGEIQQAENQWQLNITLSLIKWILWAPTKLFHPTIVNKQTSQAYIEHS